MYGCGGMQEMNGCSWDGTQIIGTLTAHNSNGAQRMPDKDPIVVLDRAAYNQGEKAKYDFEVKIGGAMPPLVARGPGAVCYRKSGHCATMTTSSHNNNR